MGLGQHLGNIIFLAGMTETVNFGSSISQQRSRGRLFTIRLGVWACDDEKLRFDLGGRQGGSRVHAFHVLVRILEGTYVRKGGGEGGMIWAIGN